MVINRILWGRALLFLAGCIFCNFQAWGEDETSHHFDLQANVPYITRGDETLTMNLYVPRGAGPYPGILLVHGGAWRMGNPWHIHSVANRLASQGYSVASISYRLAPAHRFPAQLEDCADAVLLPQTEL